MNPLPTSLALAASLLAFAALNNFLSGGLGAAGREIGLTDAESGLILSLGAFVGMVAAPLWGIAADRVGRRRVLLVAVSVLPLAATVLALAFGGASALTIPGLLLGRLLQTGFGAAIIPASQALVADMTSQGRRTNGMAVMSATLAMGSILGSALLAVTAEAGLETGFSILAGLGLLATLFAALFLRDQRKPTDRTDATPVQALLVLWPNFLATLAGYLSYSMIVPLHGLRLLDQGALSVGQANAQAGLILTAGGVALFLAQAAISLARRPNPRRLLRLGSAGALFGFAALALAETVLTMAASVVLIGGCLGASVSSNLSLISLGTGAGLQGRAAGLNAAMRALGIALGPLLGLGLYQPGGSLPVLVGLGLVIVVVLASLRT